MKSETVRLELPPKLIPVFEGSAPYRGAWGGRGSAKTRSFAKMTAAQGISFSQAGISGIILCARELVNSLDESSLAEVKEAIRTEPWLADRYEVGETYVRTRTHPTLPGKVEYAFAGLRRNLASIKSKARILVCWVDEAEQVSESAWSTLIPTLREEGEGWESELWLTWNPEREESATNQRFRVDPPEGAKIVEMNWRDNPWFPQKLSRERQEDKRKRPQSYDHIWEGKYVTYVEGAYFADLLREAEEEGRICFVAADPNLTKRAHCDIGGTGKKADHFSIVIDQFVGREIRVLDHYTAQGQPAAAHLQWLRENKHTPGNTLIVLPHDGDNAEKVYDTTYRRAFEDAGYEVEVIPNQGTGAAKMRIEAVRRLGRSIIWNKDKTGALRKALGWYHEKIDEERKIGLGPNHDWSSHDADAAGLMAISYEPPQSSAGLDDLMDETDWVA